MDLPLIIIERMSEFQGANSTEVIDCRTHRIASGKLSIFFRSEFCHWTANIIGDTFYLLHVEMPERLRGHGHGRKLYQLIVEIARDLKCTQVRQTPSGWTGTGETRLRYLIRHGWSLDGGEVYKPITFDLSSEHRSVAQ